MELLPYVNVDLNDMKCMLSVFDQSVYSYFKMVKVILLPFRAIFKLNLLNRTKRSHKLRKKAVNSSSH